MRNKPSLQPLIYSSLLFVSLFFFADRVIGYYLNDLYSKQKKGEYYETSYAMSHVKEDVLIFGSSRAMRHYNPIILEDSLKLSTFNVGKPGNTLLYSEAAFSQILTYHKPKVVILDISPIEFADTERERGQKSMIDVLLKYNDLPAIEKRINNLDPKQLILSKLFWTYKFNSSIYTMFHNDHGKSRLNQLKGYKPLNGTKIKEDFVKIDNRDYVEDPLLVKTFRDFLDNARKYNIPVHVVISPTTLYHTHNSIATIKQITTRFGYDVIDVSHEPKFKKVSFYYDKTHLNEAGAKKFSELLADTLIQTSASTINKNSHWFASHHPTS
jgi:hypothetical protein